MWILLILFISIGAAAYIGLAAACLKAWAGGKGLDCLPPWCLVVMAAIWPLSLIVALVLVVITLPWTGAQRVRRMRQARQKGE